MYADLYSGKMFCQEGSAELLSLKDSRIFQQAVIIIYEKAVTVYAE